MAASFPTLSIHGGTDRETIDATKIINDWLKSLNQAFAQKSVRDAGDLFMDDCWWRDILALSWDFTTKHGKDAVLGYAAASKHGFGGLQVGSGSLQPMLMDMFGMQWIQSAFEIETTLGTGKGLVRLANVGPNEWKAWTVYTELKQLKDVPTTNGNSRVHANGSANGTSEPHFQVFVVGAGHSGLMLGAHLQKKGLKYILVDSNPQIGDSWQNRYRSVTLHTPKYMDSYPFVAFPDDYPMWAAQSDVVAFQKHYAKELGLNVKLETLVKNVSYDATARTYTIEAETPSGAQTFTSRHLVMATGVFSNKPALPSFPSEKSFKGQIYHTSQHKSASLVQDVGSRRVVIIGVGTSAHDVAQDFVEHGAKEVSIVQRHPIFSFSRQTMSDVAASMFNTPGVSIEESDLMAGSFPVPLVRTMSVGQTQMMVQMDKELLDGMEKAGLALRRGEDGVGMIEHQLINLGHFYIDQGASQMIVDGRIKILRCEGGVENFFDEGVVLADGRRVPADIVVLATGFQRCGVAVEDVMGKAVRDKVGDIGHLDGEQERIGWWRPTGQPGFWFMSSSFMWGRQYSPAVSLQIEAIEKGMNGDHYTAPDLQERINRE